jgi:RNA polymerase sigma-70 factor (ECF subfamily)
MTDTAHLQAADLGAELDRYRGELRGYCYRMLGSAFEAEDAAQDTLVRAWRSIDRFEGRSSLRSWLYSIATNVCFDSLKGRQRRATPIDFTGPSSGDGPAGPVRPEATWVQPMPDALVVATDADPAEQAVTRESIRLALVAALQHLPPLQRAVLILRDVLRWRANEVAELLETSVASVNSALQRARATLATADVEADVSPSSIDEEQRELLARYVDAFERFDVDSLVALLREDATLSMPPYEMWMQGPESLRRWLLGGGSECEGSRLAATRANGAPAFAQWRPSGPGGSFEPWSIHVLELSDGRISAITYFVDAALFPLFGLPLTLEP